MIRKVLILFFLFIGTSNANVIGRLYFTEFLGHVHQHPLKSSNSVTIVQCSHYVKVLKKAGLDADWVYAQVGEDKGYIQRKNLSDKKPTCFQEKYPKFYQSLNLSLTEMYYWGRLYDQYSEGKSELK